MHKWESKPIWKAKERGPGVKKLQDEWNWRPVALNSLSRKAGGKFIGRILNDDMYGCGFCKGRGEKPRGVGCSICGGKGAVLVNPPAMICAYCKGSGEEKRRSNLTCTVCRGKGVIHVQKPVEGCDHCRGTGAEPTNKLPCIVCHGSGVVKVKEEAGRDSSLRPSLERQEFKSQPDSEAKPRGKPFCLPSGSEREVMEIIYELGAADSVTLGRRMIVSPSYAGYLCKSLIKTGFLNWNSGRYTLMPVGKKLLEKRNEVKQ